MTINFSGRHFPSDIILQVVRYYVSYKLSYREIEEIMAERGIHVDHSTINRWVIKYSPLLEHRARGRKKPVASSWRMDETYINVKGQWKYYYRAEDKYGDVIDFLLRETRDKKAARAFFQKAIGQHGLPEKVVIDGCHSNALALHHLNVELWQNGLMLNLIEVLQVKYLNNIVEQSHRRVKGKMHQALGWKSDEGAKASLAGIELWAMIKNEQLDNPDGLSVWDEFYALAA
ncbi:IS6 family transposase [Photobacterium sp. ZSDE20]|uniref:IS6 family transposase n=1 Tax=Photobacterium pectinilyticum TaxID=2906793 RepID=A0ABT1N8V7_9GAMM|nr:IS6 family transposase [Photobacterium sp. ZSDE20]MCQ1061188.1 IS6 family transposase [Photobacterium sp. ZSDE20]MDD1829544.1 IS6 family transposase [Photobacterium sp. ZSDE20]